MISIESDFNLADIEAYIKAEEDSIYDSVIKSLSKAGRKLVDKARAKTKAEGGFGNITWNLRASIGMCIVDQNGKIVETHFPPISKGGHGNKIGRELAERLAVYARSIDDIVLVFVAGEEYAGYVQSEEAEGRDVISFVIGKNMGTEIIKELGI